MKQITLGDWCFDNVDYDHDADVLYLSIGAPRPGYGEETPEGHVLRFDETGEFCGITMIGVREALDADEPIGITLPQRLRQQRETLRDQDLRPVLA